MPRARWRSIWHRLSQAGKNTNQNIVPNQKAATVINFDLIPLKSPLTCEGDCRFLEVWVTNMQLCPRLRKVAISKVIVYKLYFFKIKDLTQQPVLTKKWTILISPGPRPWYFISVSINAPALPCGLETLQVVVWAVRHATWNKVSGRSVIKTLFTTGLTNSHCCICFTNKQWITHIRPSYCSSY